MALNLLLRKTAGCVSPPTCAGSYSDAARENSCQVAFSPIFFCSWERRIRTAPPHVRSSLPCAASFRRSSHRYPPDSQSLSLLTQTRSI